MCGGTGRARYAVTQSGRVHARVGGGQAATGSPTEHREHVAWTKSTSVTSDLPLGTDVDSWMQICFFSLSGRSIGFHTLWRL